MSFEDWTADEIDLLESGTSVRRPSAHTSLFKYIGLNTKTSWDHLTRTLQNLELTGSTSSSLNDPFELSPNVFDDLRPSIIAAALRDSGTTELLADKPFDPELKYADTDVYRQQARDYLDRVCRYSRIISFCERSDSPLLWSHYSHSYEGACLHFLGRAFPRADIRLGYVGYSTYRPSYPLSLALFLAGAEGSAERRSKLRLAESEKLYFFTKAADWGYENEVRIVYNVNRLRSVSFQQDGLVAIVVGPRMTGENRDRLAKLVASSRVPHLPIREAVLSMNSFSVEVGDSGKMCGLGQTKNDVRK